MKNKRMLAVVLVAMSLGCEKKETTPAEETPTYGVTCPAATSNRELFERQAGGGDDAGMYVEELTGTTINSITYRNVQVLLGNYGSFTFSIDVTGCEFGAGNVIGTAQATLTPLNLATPGDLTFTFSPALTIPTNCASGKKTVGFIVTPVTAQAVGDVIVADTMAFSTSCPAQRTTTVTPPLGTDENGHAFAVTIDAD